MEEEGGPGGSCRQGGLWGRRVRGVGRVGTGALPVPAVLGAGSPAVHKAPLSSS